MKKILSVILTMVMLVTLAIPAIASASTENVWNGGEKINFIPLKYHTVYNSTTLSDKYNLTCYENLHRTIRKGEATLFQVRTLQASLERRGKKVLSANGETLENFLDKDSLVKSAQEEAKIAKAIGILKKDSYIYMNMDVSATRADVARIFAASNESVLGIPYQRNYTQFVDTAYHVEKDNISIAYRTGVMDSIFTSYFYPDNTITIDQMLGILDKEVGYYGIEKEDIAKAMNQTFMVTYDLETTKITSDITSYDLKPYEEATIKLNFYPSNKTDFEYYVDDKSICKVVSVSQSNDTIKIRGGNTGVTYIKVNVTGYPDVYTLILVNVTSKEVCATGVKIDKTATIEVGKKFYLSTVLTPSNTTNKYVKYYSDNKKTASVNSEGVITGVRKGSTVITAETKTGYKAYCIVTVTDKTVPPTSITVTEYTSVEKNYAFYLSTTVLPHNATNKSVSYSSDDESVAIVNSAGQVTAVGKGTAIITVKTYNGRKAYSKVTVTDKTVPVTGITVKNEATIEVGYAFNVSANVYPYNATNKSVKYYSDNANIAAVNSNGQVIGVSKGVTIITSQTHNGIKAYTLVTVTNPPILDESVTVYVNGYLDPSYYNSFYEEIVTFIIDTSLDINDITLGNSNCYMTEGISNNSYGFQFKVKCKTLNQSGNTLVTIKLSNGREIKVTIYMYP